MWVLSSCFEWSLIARLSSSEVCMPFVDGGKVICAPSMLRSIELTTIPVPLRSHHCEISTRTLSTMICPWKGSNPPQCLQHVVECPKAPATLRGREVVRFLRARTPGFPAAAGISLGFLGLSWRLPRAPGSSSNGLRRPPEPSRFSQQPPEMANTT